MLYMVGGAPERVLDEAELEDARALEAHCAETLACVVDCTVYGLRNDKRLTRETAEVLVATARDAALDLFPGSEALYNLLLAPRFVRVMDERFGPVATRRAARVLAFSPRPKVAAVQVHAPELDAVECWPQATES